ncbi:PQQ-binding-like beta-propeller repeat protein [Methanolobus sp. ZRKC2]|uniref:outer membrane protein assembly factor BamB family protein n=1 Tax=Methanolobus sp. ZRKC2 TaxID=3125783 RepID=UPI0032434864
MNKITGKPFFSFILIAIIIFTFLVLPASADDWPLFQKDLFNTGVTGDRAPTDTPEDWIIWDRGTSSVSSSGGIDVAPIIVDDTIYTISIDGTVWAINKTSGDVKWTNTTTKESIPPLGTPAYGNGKIFVVPNKKSIYAFDADTGVELWNDTVDTEIIISGRHFNQLITPITYYDGKIYFGEWGPTSFTSKYYCYNEDGTVCWTRKSMNTGGYYWCGATVIGKSLVFADEDGCLTSVNKDTGETIDEFAAHDFFEFDSHVRRMRSSINYQENTGRIYASSEAGYCFWVGFDKENGTFNLAESASEQIGRSSSTPAVYNGRVYVGTGTVLEASKLKTLYCLDSDSLEKIWNFTASGPIQASPVISTAFDDGDGEVYIYFIGNTHDGKVFCLKDYAGNAEPILQWTYEQPEDKKEYTLQGVAISDGWLYFANDAGYIFGLKEWNQWNDPDSDEGKTISNTELQETIYLWGNNLDSSISKEKVTRERLEKIVYYWLNP